MKKFLMTLLILSVFILSLNAQQTLQQYQTFNWSKVERASKYGVDVEQHDSEGNWTSVISEKTTETNLEVLLYPGNYRVSISTYNVLGKKASSTEWVEFTILDESEPYIFDNSFVANSKWNIPVIHISIDGENFSYGKDNSIEAVEDYIDNSFLLKGKNFFFPETKFYLKSLEEKVTDLANEPFVLNRKNVELSVIRRDREKDGIYLSYEPQELYSGYYDFVIENPGNFSVQKKILVIAERKPEIKNESLKINKRYKAAEASFVRTDNETFQITLTGAEMATSYSLEPTDEGYAYPFASSIERKSVPVSFKERSSAKSDGSVVVSLKLDATEMQTGYYNFTAKNKDGRSCTQKYLVTITEPPEKPLAVISEVEAKVKKDISKFTIKGENFTEDIMLTLVSPVNEENGTNKKISLAITDVKKNGKRIDAECSCSELGAGTYAVLAETKTSTSICYFQITEKFEVNLAKMDEISVQEIFMRPEEKEKPVVADLPVEEQKEVPAELKQLMVSETGASVNSWIALAKNTTQIPKKAFAYCTSIGILVVPDTIYQIDEYAFSGWTEKQTIFLDWYHDSDRIHIIQDNAFAGCKATIRYKDGFIYNNEFVNNYYPDYSEEKDVIQTQVSNAFEWKDFFAVNNKVLTISSDVAWSYSNTWKSANNFEKVVIKEGVTYIEKNAFCNCTNLIEVEVASSVAEILSGAFKGCRNLKKITMPGENYREHSLIESSESIFCGCSSLQEINYIGTTSQEKQLDFLAAVASKYPESGKKKSSGPNLIFSNIGLKVHTTDIEQIPDSLFYEGYLELINIKNYLALSASISGPFNECFVGGNDGQFYSRETSFRWGGKLMFGLPTPAILVYSTAGIQLPCDILKKNTGKPNAGLPSRYYPFELGIMFGGVFDFSYCLCLNQIDPFQDVTEGALFFNDYFSIGFRIPLGGNKKKSKITNTQLFLHLNEFVDSIYLEQNGSAYQYTKDVTQTILELPKAKNEVNIEWYAVSNTDIKKLKVQLVDNIKNIDLAPKGEYFIEDIKAGVPFYMVLKIPVTKKARENVTLILSCSQDDSVKVPTINSLEKR